MREDLGKDVDLVLEGGPSDVGIESTILDLSGDAPVLLRPGHISKEERNLFWDRFGKSGSFAAAPGRAGAPLRAAHAGAAGAGARAGQGDCQAKGQVAVLAFSRPDERVDYWLRMPREPQAYAQRLYAALRELDTAGCEQILVEAPPEARNGPRCATASGAPATHKTRSRQESSARLGTNRLRMRVRVGVVNR